MALVAVVAAALLFAMSGVPGLLTGNSRSRGYWCTLASSVAAVLGLVGAFTGLCSNTQPTLSIPSPFPDANLVLRLDPLSAFFLMPIFLIGGLALIYGQGYWSESERPRSATRLRFWLGLFVAAMALVVCAADGILFLVCWEVMSLSAFFLIATEDTKKQVRDAAWHYLVAAHVGALILFGLFALIRTGSGSFDLAPLALAHAAWGLRTAVFLLALVGFGVKAGVMPLHFWLPSAHANAPSHVSAIMSGVMIKLGIYGILRILTLLPAPPVQWGELVLILGTASTVLGVLFALGQHDLKRLLAYHSIENIGIILIGLGIALVGEASHRADWVALGFAACLLHVWNHGLFKSLLFLSAGSVVHATGTREIDRLGGLSRAMPRTSLMFLLGAIAICGLPPLNGFVSELLIYVGAFRTLDAAPVVALTTPFLAMAGALAVACFAKAYGAVFLGVPRSRRAADIAHDAPAVMIGPMALLAVCCAAIGVFPGMVIPALSPVITQLAGDGGSVALSGLVPFHMMGALACALALVLAVVYFFSRAMRLRSGERAGPTWDCGYARPSSRIQYTSSSFAWTLVQLFRGILRPAASEVRLTAVFPGRSEFHSHVDDPVLDGFLLPLWLRVRNWFGGLRILQRGSVQAYLLYILLILVLLLLLTSPIRELLWRMLIGEAH